MTHTNSQSTSRVLFVGAGPGDPALLTLRARDALASAYTAVVDAGVDPAVVALVGSRRSDNQQLDVRTAEGDPAEVARGLITEARNGRLVLRLVAGDPLTTESVTAEVDAIARTNIPFEIVPGLPVAAAIPAYAGIALGGGYTQIDTRGRVDWAAVAAAPGPLVINCAIVELADITAELLAHGVNGKTDAAITARGTTRQQRTVDATVASLAAAGAPLGVVSADGSEPATHVVVTIGDAVGNRTKTSWWETRALYGWTVLVPRTKDQAGDMSERLVTHGAIPVEVPTIAVEPPRSPAQMERAVKGLVDGRYQWIVFTSTNAVKAVWEKFADFGLDARAFSGVKIACVGQATADKVRSFGINPEIVPTGEQSSLGLLDEFPEFDDIFDPVNRVLLPRADIATETLSEGLRERGWEVDDVTAYRTVRAAPPAASIREMIKSGGFDAVLFTSSSTVRNLVGIAGKPHARTIVACIGPKTAETAIEFGLRVDVQPDLAQVDTLVDALATHAARLRAEGALPPPRKRKRR